MTSWLRSARTLICNYMSNSISPRGKEGGQFMLSTPGGQEQLNANEVTALSKKSTLGPILPMIFIG